MRYTHSTYCIIVLTILLYVIVEAQDTHKFGYRIAKCLSGDTSDKGDVDLPSRKVNIPQNLPSRSPVSRRTTPQQSHSRPLPSEYGGDTLFDWTDDPELSHDVLNTDEPAFSTEITNSQLSRSAQNRLLTRIAPDEERRTNIQTETNERNIREQSETSGSQRTVEKVEAFPGTV